MVGQQVGRNVEVEEVEEVEEGPKPAPLAWWALQWLTLALVLSGGGILAAPSHLFSAPGDSGHGGYAQFGFVLMMLAGSAMAAMAGVLVGLWAFGRGTPLSSLRLGFGLDAGILALVLALVVLT
jgi:hypothetical protein